MRKKIPFWVNILLASVFGLVIALAVSSPDNATNLLPHTNGLAAISNQQLQAAYAKLPLSFEANLGQTHDSVKFLSRGSGYSLFLTPTEAVLALSTPQDKSSDISHRSALKPQPTANTSPTVVHMQLLESNQQPKVTGLEQLPGIVNYFLGNDPHLWHRNIPTYAKVQYQQVYPGVDMVYYGNQGLLEYDFVMAPGTDLNIIKLALQGVEKLEVNDQQELVLHTAAGSVKLHQPLAYQQVNGLRKAIASHYVLKGKNQVGFQVAAYDRSQPLIIDPVLSYSTNLGGSNYYGSYTLSDMGTGIAVDRDGNAYVTGEANAINFPTQNPFQATLSPNPFGNLFPDAFVTKLNATGDALVYSTYLGGSSLDQGQGIAVDREGNAYVTGLTGSTNFPTQNPFQSAANSHGAAFVTKLDATGSALVYSTYLDGNSVDDGNGIAVDIEGNAYVTGYTNSTNFPTQNPLQTAIGGGNDAFVTKLNATGDALVYSTYLGDSSDDRGYGIAVDQAGKAYVTGVTISTHFPTQNPFQAAEAGNYDAFVTKLDSTGNALVYSTYLGGSSGDSGNGIAVDKAGKAYITGITTSTDFPTENPFQATSYGAPTVFVTSLDATGSALVYSTYLGGLGRRGDYGTGIAVDRASNAYVTGVTTGGFPTQNPFQPGSGSTFGNAFVTKLTP